MSELAFTIEIRCVNTVRDLDLLAQVQSAVQKAVAETVKGITGFENTSLSVVTEVDYPDAIFTMSGRRVR